MSSVSPLSASSDRPRPRFTVASWSVLAGGLLLTFGVYELAVAHRNPGEWLPGIGEAIIGIGVTAVATTACALTALLRRERHRWAAILPFLAGLGTILYATWNLLQR